MERKEVFRKWCEAHPEISLFQQYDWLNTVAAPENWDVALVENSGDVSAFMPYFKKRKLNFDVVTVPPLTPYLGPLIYYPEGQKTATRLSHEKKMMEALIAQLPKTDRFIQYFHPQITNWLPFHWAGFEQSTRYTYVLEDLSDPNKLFEDLNGNIRREIQKAQKSLSVVEAESVRTLHELKLVDYANKRQDLNYDLKYLQNIHTMLHNKNCCKVWEAEEDGKTIAALMLVWDADTAYYLVGAADPKKKTTGAMSLLLWTAILFASSVVHQFNFEGSMVEPIERYFRSFGAKQTPYFEIRKTDSKLLKLL
jgi:lipid II:glycine glycyltransferase (peptidoglycan interpeptide bridge formation enzyme)